MVLRMSGFAVVFFALLGLSTSVLAADVHEFNEGDKVKLSATN